MRGVMILGALVTATAPAGASTAETYQGTVQATVADDFTRGTSTTTFALVSSSGSRTALAPEDGSARSGLMALSGRPAIVSGSKRGDGIRVTAARAARSRSRSATADTRLGSSHRGELKVGVFMVNFPGNATQPFTAAEIRTELFDGAASAAAGIRQESAGRNDLSGTVYGWWTLGGFDSCDTDAVASAVEAHASANGIDLNAFQRIAIMMPTQSCFTFAGRARVPGRVSWYNGYNNAETYLHELGHNSGLTHANLHQCTAHGAQVTIAPPSNCTSQEYGDPLDYMGGKYRGALAAAFNRGQLGLLEGPSEVVRVDGVGQAASIQLAQLNQDTGTRQILVPRRIPGLPTTFFSVDLRSTASPFDNWASSDPAVSGVAIRLTPAPGTIGPTQLVDFAPATVTGDDAPFPSGTALSDPSSGVSISVDRVDAGHALLRVVGPATPDVTPPRGGASITIAGRTATATWSGVTDDEGGPVRLELRRDGVAAANSPAASGSLTASIVHPGVTTFQLVALDASDNAAPLVLAKASAPDARPAVADARVKGRTISWRAATDDWGVREIRILHRTARGHKLLTTLDPATTTFTVPVRKTRQQYIVKVVDVAGQTGSSALLTVRHDEIHARRLRKVSLRLHPSPRSQIRGRTIRVVASYPAGIESIRLRLGARKATCVTRRSCTLRGSASALKRASGVLSIRITTKDGEQIATAVRIRRGRLGPVGKLR